MIRFACQNQYETQNAFARQPYGNSRIPDISFCISFYISKRNQNENETPIFGILTFHFAFRFGPKRNPKRIPHARFVFVLVPP